jgi:hypothetical protein
VCQIGTEARTERQVIPEERMGQPDLAHETVAGHRPVAAFPEPRGRPFEVREKTPPVLQGPGSALFVLLGVEDGYPGVPGNLVLKGPCTLTGRLSGWLLVDPQLIPDPDGARERIKAVAGR